MEGNYKWQGDLKEGEKAQITATIKAVKKGTCEIQLILPFFLPRSEFGWF